MQQGRCFQLRCRPGRCAICLHPTLSHPGGLSWCYSGASCWKMLPGISNCRRHLLFLSWLPVQPWKKGEKKQKHETLIRSKRTGGVPPPPPCSFLSPHHLFSLLSALSLALVSPRSPVSFPLSSSQGASTELAVVTRLMDDSESGVGGGRRQGDKATELPAITLWTCAVPNPHKPPLAHKSCFAHSVFASVCVCAGVTSGTHSLWEQSK